MIQYEEGRHRAAPRRIVKRKLANRDQFTESSAIEAINLGVGGYLVKPFRASDVMAVVARALSVPAA